MSVELLYRALDSELGIAVSTNDPKRLREKLYALRRASPDPALAGLTLQPSRTKPTSELWIVRQTPKSKETSANGS